MDVVGAGFTISDFGLRFKCYTLCGNVKMHELQQKCISAAVENWKKGEPNTRVCDVLGHMHKHRGLENVVYVPTEKVLRVTGKASTGKRLSFDIEAFHSDKIT